MGSSKIARNPARRKVMQRELAKKPKATMMAMTTTQRSATTLTSGRGWDSGCTLSGIDVREEKSRSLVPERKMARSGRDHNGMRCSYIRRPREVRLGRHELTAEKRPWAHAASRIIWYHGQRSRRRWVGMARDQWD